MILIWFGVVLNVFVRAKVFVLRSFPGSYQIISLLRPAGWIAMLLILQCKIDDTRISGASRETIADMSEPAPATAPVFSLDIERCVDHATVLCHGKLVAGVSDVLYREVSKLLPGTKRIVLDLTNLTKMDSMGLGSVVRLYVSCKSAGAELQLVNLGPRIRQLLGMTHLLSAFTVIGENNVVIH